MHSTLIWPALTVFAGAAVFVPAVEDSGLRTILYWIVLPSLLLGLVVVFAHLGVL